MSGRVRHAQFNLRQASLGDLADLVALEQVCFTTDRISRRQFRYLLTRANASILVAESEQGIFGDVVVLYSRATSVARVYSLAVAESWRGRGVGLALMKIAEAEAWSHRRAYLRLEVREDNHQALNLYRSLGYRHLGEVNDYYQDHTGAVRLEKSLSPDMHPELAQVPYYEQSLEFTCGAAALMMAMKALKSDVEFSRHLELRLWREATTIFMTSGHGGCGPFGLGLAAAKRDFRTVVYVTSDGIHLVDSVRSQEKKEVMRLVQEEMHAELLSLGVPIIDVEVTLDEMVHCFNRGGIPLVLISSWQIYKARAPHWVVVTGFDEHFVYVNDPFIDHKEGETAVDSIHMPILKEKFQSMARYGRVGLQAMVVLYADGCTVKDMENA